MDFFKKKSYRAATGAYRAVLKCDRKNETAIFYLALSLYHEKKYQKSLRCWESLRGLNPTQENMHLNIGCAYQAIGRNDLAIWHFKRELVMNPASGETLYSLGTLYYNLHKFKMASNYLERCYSLKHSIEKVVDRLAWTYYKTKRHDKEVALYNDWLRDHPNDGWCLNNMGAVLMDIGEYSRAQLFLQKAERTRPRDKMVSRNLEKVRVNRIKARALTKNKWSGSSKQN